MENVEAEDVFIVFLTLWADLFRRVAFDFFLMMQDDEASS